MAKNKDKKSAPEKKAKAAKAPAKRMSATLKPFLILAIAAIVLSAGLTAFIQILAVKDIKQNAQDIHVETMAQSTESLLAIHFDYTSRQLASLAKDEQVIEIVHANDQEHIDRLEKLLLSSFNDSISLRIIPWDYTATVGLRDRGVEMRNSIETLMLTRAGGGRVPEPEVYQHEKKWLISFAQPIMDGNEVKAIMLLTYDEKFFAGIVNNEFYRSNAALSVKHKGGSGQTLASNKSTAVSKTISLDLPFTDGQLTVASARDVSNITSTAVILTYIGVSISSGLLAILSLFLFTGVARSLRRDVANISHYAESLTGLHRTMPPENAHPELNELVENFTNVYNRTRSAVSPHDHSSPRREVTRSAVPEKLATAEVEETSIPFPAKHIFRDYDIRGIADKELTDENVELIGKAIGTEAHALNISSLYIGRDGRLSGERIFNALSKGITSTGISVVNIGIVPTPVLYFAAHQDEKPSGIMITASHNPAEDNGLKMLLAGKTLQGPLIQRLLARIEKRDFINGDMQGSISEKDIRPMYQESIANDILIAKPMKVVIDAGNGTGGELAVALFKQLNCEVIPLYCEVDGTFPNHSPDPSVAENLGTLISNVIRHQADLGIAFDGDADRMVAVTSMGQIIDGDKLLMIFAEDIVSRNPAATVIYDVKCSSYIRQLVQQYGGRPVMWKTGHANIKAKMQETGALLGGEFTGHYFFKERWFGFDDGIYSALRLVELLTNDNQSLDQRVGKLPSRSSTSDINIPVANDKTKFDIIRQLQASMSGESGDVIKLDGVRIDYDNGFGLIRASNTRAALTARFEADSADEMARIQTLFRNALLAVNDNISVPF